MVESGQSCPSMIDVDKALQVAHKAALLGREVLLNYFGHLKDVSEKDQAGLVSEADVESERVISEYLLSEFPTTSIYGEEGEHSKQDKSLDPEKRKRGVWLIDPLDGTTNYVHKFPIYCVSIGFEYEGELLAAACDVPCLRKTYLAAKNRGATLEGEILQVSHRKTLGESLLATGFSAYDKSAMREQLQIFGALMPQVRGIRRAGSAAFDLCMVAEGVFDAYWEKNLSPWDTAAGALLVREAGGVVTSYDQDHFDPFMRSILAGNPAVHGAVRQQIHAIQKS